MTRLAGFVRLGHPFPSILDGVMAALAALVAGGGAADAVRLGVAMVALQVGIGATNDLVDAPRDAGHKPGKPIPAGLVTRRDARLVIVVAVVLGLGLASVSGVATLAVALVGVTIGLLYNLALKGTAWSWLPFALGVPLVPVFGWLGATGSLPGAFFVLVPAAFAAGAALAIANALADLDRDLASGTGSIAVALGPDRAWALDALLVALICVAAVASVPALHGPSGEAPAVRIAAAAPIAGVLLSRAGPAWRERGWEVQAVGLAVLAVAWLVAVLT